MYVSDAEGVSRVTVEDLGEGFGGIFTLDRIRDFVQKLYKKGYVALQSSTGSGFDN